MTDVPDDVVDVFDARETFAPSGSGYVVETTSFEGHVTASEGEQWRTDYEVTVRAPSLQAATVDEVGPAVRDGWLETLERRLEDAPKSTRVAVDLDEYTVERDDEEVVQVAHPIGVSVGMGRKDIGWIHGLVITKPLGGLSPCPVRTGGRNRLAGCPSQPGSDAL